MYKIITGIINNPDINIVYLGPIFSIKNPTINSPKIDPIEAIILLTEPRVDLNFVGVNL